MRQFSSRPELARRAFTWCLAGVYSALALLGSEGLHAILPHHCAAHTHSAEHCHSHSHGHDHNHAHHHCGPHSHSHGEKPEHAPVPAPCDSDDCLICKHSLTPVVVPVTVELIVAEVLIAREASRAPPRVESAHLSQFFIRGPPTA
jgi:hypothetical protein